jgi:hypothetical protein
MYSINGGYGCVARKVGVVAGVMEARIWYRFMGLVLFLVVVSLSSVVGIGCDIAFPGSI